MAVEAMVDVIIRKLTDLVIHDSIALDNVIDQIEDIRIRLRRMRGFLTDTEPNAVDLAQKCLEVVFSVEDEIEKYVLSLAARGRRNIGFFQRRGFTLFADVYDFCGPARLLRHKLDDLANKIKNLEPQNPLQVVDVNPYLDEREECASASSSAFERSLSDLSPVERKRFESTKSFPSIRSSRGSRSPSASPGGHRRHPKLTNYYQDQEGPTLIGFKRDQELLVQRLTEGGEGVIPLVGPAGSGKTTLVHTIYDLREIKTHFTCRAWIKIPDESVPSSQLLDTLLQQVLKIKEGGIPNAEQLNKRVWDSLKDKTYLVVLDNISVVRQWKDMKSAFPELEVGVSKVMLITRDHKLVGLENCSPHRLDEMCHEHSWDLLIKKAGLDQKSSQLYEGLKHEILGKCKGRPLDIVLLGGLLSTKEPSCDEWKWYLSQPSWQKMEKDSPTKEHEILQLSYNDLPAHAKLCLLYMALFPNEVDISVRRLHRLWLAEGFVRRTPGMYEEDSVEECFDDLVQRNFIQVSKFKSDGSPKRCHLPRAVREYLSPKAHQISLFYIHQKPVTDKLRGLNECPPKLDIRRVVEYVDIKNGNASSNSATSPCYENVRSYLSFNFQRNDSPAIEVGNFISKIIGNKGYGVLRVLDLEGVYKPTLPETLNQLFHLRYLGLRWTFMDQLPKSVGNLPYLETLDLKRTYINNLPDSIWKLSHLRHLNLPGIRLDYKQKKGHSSLTELRTLVGLIVDNGSAVEELSQLLELRELGITCQLSSPEELTSLSSWIQNLTNLKFLGLKSKDKMGQPSKIKLEPLQKLSKLSHVSLLGNIEKLPASNEFPPNLKVLALSVSCLTDDPMKILSKLPSLSVLRLLANSYLGTDMKCPKNGFKKLRVLKLWMLEELVEWTVGKGGMPHLKELNIRKCLKLKQIPSQLLHQVSLEELTLTSMQEEFVQRVKQEKRSHTVLTENEYEFTSLPWEKNPELWRS